MRRRLVAGNWKMNGSRASVKALCQSLKEQVVSLFPNQKFIQGFPNNGIEPNPSEKITSLPRPFTPPSPKPVEPPSPKPLTPPASVEILVFPPFIFIPEVQKELEGTAIGWGAQNISAQRNGAYTGEISASMLEDFGCTYVILGHSERRRDNGESDEMIAQKFKTAVQSHIKPIVCIGESLIQRQQGLTEKILEQQLKAILSLDLNQNLMHNAIFAYEPIWAIGTGVAATIDQIQSAHCFIRAQVAKYANSLAEDISIIYGGSVKASNAAEIFAIPDVDGALVGNASLDSNEFLEICRCNN